MFMSLQNERDPRSVLVREKYFSLRPKPLERWLWDQGVPQAAERVFWLHWEEGMRRGDWCSEVPLRIVARECRIDLSTVTRAYQVLRKLSLIRRQRAPRIEIHAGPAISRCAIELTSLGRRQPLHQNTGFLAR